MKTAKLFILPVALLFVLNSACIVKHDNGKHKGWFKGPKNSSSSNKKAGNPGKGNKK